MSENDCSVCGQDLRLPPDAMEIIKKHRKATIEDAKKIRELKERLKLQIENNQKEYSRGYKVGKKELEAEVERLKAEVKE